jgi:hypothetical protein
VAPKARPRFRETASAYGCAPTLVGCLKQNFGASKQAATAKPLYLVQRRQSPLLFVAAPCGGTGARFDPPQAGATTAGKSPNIGAYIGR